jgi:hypothetical protein
MRILEQTPDRLVLEIRPIALMILCAGLFLLFLLLGFGMPQAMRFFAALAGAPDAPGLSALDDLGMNLLGYASVVPLLIGVFLIKARRLTFDRPSGRITVASRGVLGRSETSYSFAGFRGASVARNRRAGNNSTTHTAMLDFADQTVPVTPYGTGGREPARFADAVDVWKGPRSFGEGRAITLSGDQAKEAVEKLGIKLPR